MSSEYLNNKMFESIIKKFREVRIDKNKYEMLLEDMRECERRLLDAKDWKPLAWRVKEEQFNGVLRQFHDSQAELASAFYTLSENIVRYAKFSLIDADDAIQEGVMICFEKIDRFDSSKGKAFNYLTTCVINNLRQLYRTARNYNELKRKYLVFIENSLGIEISKRKSRKTASCS